MGPIVAQVLGVRFALATCKFCVYTYKYVLRLVGCNWVMSSACLRDCGGGGP